MTGEDRQSFPIGVLFPLTEEYEAAEEILTPIRSFDANDQTFYVMKSPAGTQFVAAIVGGAGGQEASTVVAERLAALGIEVLVVIGIAGSLDSELRLGDVIAPSLVDLYRAGSKAVPGATEDEFELLFAGDPFRPPWSLIRMVEDLKTRPERRACFVGWRDEASARRVELGLHDATALEYGRPAPSLHGGHMASGPEVAAATAFGKWLKTRRDRSYEAIEMESGGVSVSAYRRRRALPVLVLRGISDLADERKTAMERESVSWPRGAWRKLAAQNAAALLGRFIDEGWLLAEGVPGLSPKPAVGLGSLSVQSPRPDVPIPPHLQPPAFRDPIDRRELADRIARAAGSANVVAVEGLGGSGKTYAAAQFASQVRSAGFWLTLEDNSTPDDVIIALSGQLGIRPSENLNRVELLVHELGRHDAVLFLDDFHRADAASMAPLLHAAGRSGRAGGLVLISREQIDLPTDGTAKRVIVGGLDEGEIGALLQQIGVPDPPSYWLSGLAASVDGLILAVSLFATAVVEFGRDGDDLLSGQLTQQQRLRRWFAEIIEAIGNEAQRLLQVLSLVDSTINSSLVKEAIKHFALDGAVDSFEMVQRAHLIQRVGAGAWTVHHLIASMMRKLTSVDAQWEMHAWLARHFLVARPRTARATRLLDEDDFDSSVEGIHHLVSSQQFGRAATELSDIAGTAKARGRCRAFVRAARPVLTHRRVNYWLDYHVAHCDFATGHLCDAVTTLDAVEARSPAESTLALSLARLRGEVLGALGYPDRGLAHVSKALATSQVTQNATPRYQAQTARATLLLATGDYESAENVIEDLSAQIRDPRGRAATDTLAGYLALGRRQWPTAVESFSKAAVQFGESRDARGESWALAGLARSLLGGSWSDEMAIEPAAASIKIRAYAGECSAEYAEFLDSILNRLGNAAGMLVPSEHARVAATLADERARFDRTANATALAP